MTPLIEKKILINSTTFGRIDLVRTSVLLARGQTQVVSIKTDVVTETLPLLLLIRFNIEISMALREFIEKLEETLKRDSIESNISIERISRQNLLFHQDFVFNPRYAHLVNKSIEIDFLDPDIIDKTYQQLNGNPIFQDILLLWENYQTGKALRSSIIEHMLGGYTLKPMSKIYELWLLKKLDTIIKQKYGEPNITVHPKGSMTFKYKTNNQEIILNYNVTIPRAWKRFKPTSFTMRPDFVIAIKKGREILPVFFGDAKYKEKASNSDKQQMMAYLLATGWGESISKMFGAILFIGTQGSQASLKMTRTKPTVEIVSINIRPDSDQSGLDSLIMSVI